MTPLGQTGPSWLDRNAGKGRGSKAVALSVKLGLAQLALWTVLGFAKSLFAGEAVLEALTLYAADNFGNITLGLATTAYVVFTYQLLETAEAQRRLATEPLVTITWQSAPQAASHQVTGIKEWIQSACALLKASGIDVAPMSLPASSTRYVQLQLSNAKDVPVTWLQLRVTAVVTAREPPITPSNGQLPFSGQIDLKDVSLERGAHLSITVADVGAVPAGLNVNL